MPDVTPSEEPDQGVEVVQSEGTLGVQPESASTALPEPLDTTEPLEAADDFGPQPDVRTFLETWLEANQTRLGQVYRLQKEGAKPQQIADSLSVNTYNFVYNYRKQISAVLDGATPGGTSLARQTARMVNGWLARESWPDAVRSYLTALAGRLDSVANNPQLIEKEEAEAAAKTEQAEKAGVPGVYVYSLPHYLRHRVDSLTQRTYLKVGHSATDAQSRVDSQSKSTALPEDLVLLRIYPTDDSAAEEKEFHKWLEAADHSRSRPKREWFLTSTKFLDRIASARNLTPTLVNDDTI